MTFKARDGLALHGYLTLPLGRAPRNLPLVIHPHGGPFGIRDSWGFIPEVQFYANLETSATQTAPNKIRIYVDSSNPKEPSSRTKMSTQSSPSTTTPGGAPASPAVSLTPAPGPGPAR